MYGLAMRSLRHCLVKNNIEACRKVFDAPYETIEMGDTLDGTEGRSTDAEEEDEEEETTKKAREEANVVPSIEQ